MTDITLIPQLDNPHSHLPFRYQRMVAKRHNIPVMVGMSASVVAVPMLVLMALWLPLWGATLVSLVAFAIAFASHASLFDGEYREMPYIRKHCHDYRDANKWHKKLEELRRKMQGRSDYEMFLPVVNNALMESWFALTEPEVRRTFPNLDHLIKLIDETPRINTGALAPVAEQIAELEANITMRNLAMTKALKEISSSSLSSHSL